ncbi:NAD(P)H-binding protein [Gordonia terrae]
MAPIMRPEAGTTLIGTPSRRALTSAGDRHGTPLRIAVIGLDGPLEASVIHAAATAGHEVTVGRIQPDRLTGSRSRLIDVDSADLRTASDALSGADAAIVTATVGAPLPSGFLATLTDIARHEGLDRLVFAVDPASRHRPAGADRLARIRACVRVRSIARSSTPVDEPRLDLMLAETRLNWTIVYTAALVPGTTRSVWNLQPVRRARRLSGSTAIPYSTLASTLVRQASDLAVRKHRLLMTTPGQWISDPLPLRFRVNNW